MCVCSASVEYLGHLLSHEGIAKGPKVDAVTKMPRPENVSSLKSFLVSVQFYSKFIPNLATITEPLYNVTRRNVKWTWSEAEEAVFHKLKNQFLYSRKFILVTDHKPLRSRFGPHKATPALAANRLARWALMLNQY